MEAGLENIKHFGGVKVEERIDDSFDEFSHSKSRSRIPTTLKFLPRQMLAVAERPDGPVISAS